MKKGGVSEMAIDKVLDRVGNRYRLRDGGLNGLAEDRVKKTITGGFGVPWEN